MQVERDFITSEPEDPNRPAKSSDGMRHPGEAGAFR